MSPFHGDALPSPTGEGFQKALLVKHVALVKRGKGLSDEEADIDVELKHAREGGALSAELYDLLLIHHLYEEFASLTTGTIMLEGLILLVMNMFKAHQRQMNDDIIRHHALLLAREIQGDNAGRRAACRQEDGVSFDQFLAYAVSNLHVLEPLLQQTRSRFSSQQVDSEPCPRSYSFSPCFKAVVWVSDDQGQTKVEDIVDVKEGPCLEGSYRAVLESDPKATWLARCAAAATDALACMLRSDNGLPSMITLDLPATSQEAQAEADVSSAPNSDDTEFVKLVEYVVGRLKNPENEPPRSPAHTLVGIRLKELHKLLNKLPQGWTLKDARAQPEKLKEMCGSAAPAAHSMNHVVPDGVRYSIHARDTFKVGEKCVIKRTDGTWRFGVIMRTESKTKYVVQVNHDGTHKTGISGENLGKLAAASPPAGGIAFGQKESALLFRVLYPSSWESFIPKSFTKPTSAPKASPSGKRLSGSGDTRPGAILRFSPISTYSYPATLQREALVTFLAHNAGSPPANVKWHSGTTYWVNWEDLVDEERALLSACEDTISAGEDAMVLLQGAGGRGSVCNGTYRVSGQHNGKPLYVKDGDKCKIYFSDYWKISSSGSTSGWIYGVDSRTGKGPYPPTSWRDDGYSSTDNRPFPTLQFLRHKSATGGAGESRFDDMPALKTFFGGIDGQMGASGRDQLEWLLDFRALCALPVCWDCHASKTTARWQIQRFSFDCYVGMSTLLSLSESLLKTKKLKPGDLLTKAHLEEAVGNAVIPQIQASIRKLRVHLMDKPANRQKPDTVSAAKPSSDTASCEFEEEDIIIVMEITGVDRARALSALAEHRDAAGAVLAIEEEQSATHEVGQEAVMAQGGVEAGPVDGAGPDPTLDTDVLLQQLAVIVTRVSLMMMHLVNFLPLAALSVESAFDASAASEMPPTADTQQHIVMSSVLDEKFLSALTTQYPKEDAEGDEEGGSQQGDNGIAAAARARESAAHNLSLRRLLGAGTQIMLKEHKAPLIQKIFDANPIAQASRADVSVDRFKALSCPGQQNENTILSQIRRGLSDSQRKGLGGDRWWKVAYAGEDGSDAGGLFRDSLSALSTELQRAADAFGERDTYPCPLFLPTELFQEDLSGRKQLVGAYLMPNASADSKECLSLYEFLGQLMGACARSQETLSVALAPIVWKQLLGREVQWDEVAELEPAVAQELAAIESGLALNGYSYTEKEFDEYWSTEKDFTVSFGEPCRQVAIMSGGASRKLTFRSRLEYTRLVKAAYLHRFDKQISAMRRGLLQYLPESLLLLWRGDELELAVAGEPDVPLDKLKNEASVSLPGDRKKWFWESVGAMTVQQRSKLLRFVTGRSRLPVGKFYVKETSGSDGALPHSATCSFELFVPPYSSQEILSRQLLVAIETEDFGNR